MNPRPVFHLIAIVLVVLAVCLGICAAIAVASGDPPRAVWGIGASAVITLAAGLLLMRATRGPIDLTRRDGFGIVAFGWLAASLFGALPYLLSGAIADPVDAVFETMSGFTTTGATVLPVLEHLPRGILFWRSLTQWIGGMGVLVLCVAILPFLGVGGMQIYRAEMPGPSKERLTPRIARTAEYLWGVYLVLSVLQCILLRAGGMDWFDACCHTFTTLSTGGFSTLTASVGGYNSLYIESVITVFMLLAGINFALHFRAATGRPLHYARDPECRAFLGIWLAGCVLLAADTWGSVYPTLAEAVRAAVFQCTSILTTTGYATADFDAWPNLSRILLVAMMFCGGCAGSTAGGIKVVRIQVMLKTIQRELRTYIQPHAIVHVKLGRKPVGAETVSNIAVFLIIFVCIFTGATVLMSLWTPDLVTAATSVAATLGNIGPGLAAVGPAETFAFIPAPGKLLLTICMLLGRLELFTVLVLFMPSFWRR
jgi:trk system potassium uptake protein TrkH